MASDQVEICFAGLEFMRARFVPFPKSTFANIIRDIDKMEFVMNICGFNDPSQPLPLLSSVCRKVHDDRQTFLKQRHHVRRNRVPQPGRTADVVIQSGNFVRK